MLNKRLLIVVAPLLSLTFFLTQEVFSQESANCLACHNPMAGRIEIQKGTLVELNVDSKMFYASVHGSLSCTDCHTRFSDNPHALPSAAVSSSMISILPKISLKHSIDAVAASACIKCHEDIYNEVLNSIHGKNIVEKKQTDGALCLDCHGSPHYLNSFKDPESRVSRENQVATCGRCHEDQRIIKKYKLQENVMNSFRESFHGRKLHLGHTSAPVCSSCHNSHDIKSKNDPTSPVFGDNKLQTCGKCHKGANKKFIPAITHKPPGSIPHYFEKALILLTMGVFTFIVLHVMLEAFSDIRDAIFRKGRKE